MSITLEELLPPDQLLLDLRVADKRHALRELSTYAGAALRMPSQPIFDALERREQLGSTGLGQGFALPHARIEGLDRFFALLARLNRPVAFAAVDDKPVDLLFLLLIPTAHAEEHVALMASICRLMREATFAERVRKSRTTKELHSLLQMS
jgi:PTS system nitrogen regulatory IIA component